MALSPGPYEDLLGSTAVLRIIESFAGGILRVWRRLTAFVLVARVRLSRRLINMIESLYIHVPFCAAKCHYCAFYSAAPDGDLVNRYVNAIVRELEMVAGDLNPRTIFFGGGTPSLLTVKQWTVILEAMHRLGLSEAEEWTVECNPATVSVDKAKLLVDAGVNRISMGVQSLNDELLDRLGRIHSRESVYRSVEILRSAGIRRLNLDLMFAIPGQSLRIWEETLKEAMQLQPDHLSSYEVIYEEDTALYAQLKAGEFDVDEDLACEMYERLVQIVGEDGFIQYEVANFAKTRTHEPHPFRVPTEACRHNVNYWRGGEFHGLGPSASGMTKGVRTKNWSNTQLYCERIEKGHRAIESRDTLTPFQRAGEIAGFGLRMNTGWSFSEFKSRTGFDLREHWTDAMESLAQRDHARILDDRFHLTPLGLRFADAATQEFLC